MFDTDTDCVSDDASQKNAPPVLEHRWSGWLEKPTSQNMNKSNRRHFNDHAEIGNPHQSRSRPRRLQSDTGGSSLGIRTPSAARLGARPAKPPRPGSRKALEHYHDWIARYKARQEAERKAEPWLKAAEVLIEAAIDLRRRRPDQIADSDRLADGSTFLYNMARIELAGTKPV